MTAVAGPRARRGDVEGSIAIDDDDRVWFKPDAALAPAEPLNKYDSSVTWEVACVRCHKPVRVCAGGLETIGPYHAGCFGYPACCCDTAHEGDCR